VKSDKAFAKGAHDSMLAMASAGRKLTIATWNIAAINNNPFEYWLTIPDNPAYEELMINVEKFLDAPGDKDVSVSNVFTDDMFGELDKQMTDIGWPSVRTYWDDDFKKRKIISGFMKDPLLGSKRLASMPDRVTNTINVDGSPEPVCRPTVINMYGGDLGTLEKWWGEWKTFMFVNPLKIKTTEGIEESIPYQLLQPIKKSKYPDITKEEETVSLPLQTMCGAIFDAILVHMMNTVSTPDVWQPLKSNMVESLNKKKVPHTLEILENTYAESDIITLQEVSSSFIDQAQSGNLGEKFHVVSPKDLDAVRDQNSVIFLNKKTFPGGKIKEITPLVEDSFENADVPVSKGDILAITTKSMDGVPFVIASFHGDTNGLATKPVLDAIVKAMSNDKKLSNHQLVFGLDANTYETEKPGKNQGVMDFVSRISHHNLASCWGEKPKIPKSYTTYNARTYLQPQLNKACKSTEKRECGDVNPKDFIIFAKDAFSVEKMWKDNTGEKKYIEDMAFPTLTFPSDHGILATVLKPKAS